MRYEIALLLSLAAVLVWSGIQPHDRFTWFLEVAPVLIGVPILIGLWLRFRLTRLVYTLLWIHAIILMVGGKYTYAEVPFGFWLQDVFGFARNHYDRIGHFAQGFVPAMLAREVLIRRSPLRGSRWLPFANLGAGLTHTSIREPDLSTGFEFNLVGGFGTHYFYAKETAITVEARWFHLSNGGLDSPNRGTNTVMLLAGLSWFY